LNQIVRLQGVSVSGCQRHGHLCVWSMIAPMLSSMIMALPWAPNSVMAATTHTPYDCETGNWHDDPGQQAWCCLYAGRGCPDTTTTTEAPPGCGTVCDFGGKSFDCSARIRYTAQVRFHGKKGSCEMALAQVLGECPVCSHCSLAESRCAVTSPLTTHVPADSRAACSKICHYGGTSGACDSRIRWGATHKYLNHKQACQKAWTMVASQCPSCTSCTPDFAGCVLQGAPDESDVSRHCTDHGCIAARESASFDCSVGFADWRDGWSEAKKTWCCNHRDKACKFDCLAGFVTWRSTWSDEKKAWCCRERGHGCKSNEEVTGKSNDSKGSSEKVYDCLAGLSMWEDGWSKDKQRWCCEKHNHGCPGTFSSAAFDCLAGIAMWETGWSDAKKRWCCHNRNQGCSSPFPATTTTPPRSSSSSSSSHKSTMTTITTRESTTTTESYDCRAGTSNWLMGWSVRKKEWCCKKKRVHCIPRGQFYDCHKGLARWKDKWSPEKRDWCCRRKEIHCEDIKLHYDCLTGLTNWEHGWSNDKKRWCCRKHPKACKQQTLPVVAAKLFKKGVRHAPWHPIIVSSWSWPGKLIFWVISVVFGLSVAALVAVAANRSTSRLQEGARSLARQQEDLYSPVATDEPRTVH